MLPWEQDVSDSGAIAVNSEQAKRQGDFRHQRAVTLNQEEDQNQRQHRQHGEERLMIPTETHTHTQ